MSDYTATLTQDGIVVAEVSAPTFEQAEREIMHYAMMYAQDGPVVVKLPTRPPTDAPADGER